MEKGAGALVSVAAVIIIIFGMQAAKVLRVPFLILILHNAKSNDNIQI